MYHMCACQTAVQTGSGGRLHLRVWSLTAPWRAWSIRRGQSAQLLGHAHPADMAFCGRLSPLEGAQGSGGACLVFGGSDLEKEYESSKGCRLPQLLLQFPSLLQQPRGGVETSPVLREETERERGLSPFSRGGL